MKGNQTTDHDQSGGKHSLIQVTAVLLFALFIMPAAASAGRNRYVLDFKDTHLRGHPGREATLFLKKELHHQYPWLDISNLELNKVILVAKTKKGRGEARLRVGSLTSEPYRIAGRPGRFHSRHPDTFDRIRMRPPYRKNRGPWQVHLKGNVKVRKVILVVDDRYRRPMYGWWSHRW